MRAASPASSPAPIRWPAEAIWQAVEPHLPGFTVEVLPEVDSSNSELMRRFRATPCQNDPVLLVAEQQNAGRGRLGRQWQSQRGASLTFSLGLPFAPVDWSGLSLAVGISVAESLDASGNAVGLKWPNDLWLQRPGQAANGRKLAGILVETANRDELRYVVIGVGINIRPVDLAADAGTASVAPSNVPGCLEEIDHEADAAATLLRIVPALVQNLQAFERFGFAPFQARFARRDVLADQAVAVHGAQGITHGTAHGVGENGALLVHTAAGMKEITSSEVSIRPLSGGFGSVAGSRPDAASWGEEPVC
jgi:BirA family biotin operon repressor/biotin-[acetyl-CoA-carboxylase] ligase